MTIYIIITKGGWREGGGGGWVAKAFCFEVNLMNIIVH